MRACREELTLTPADLDQSDLMVAVSNGAPVAVVQVGPAEDAVQSEL